MAQANTFAKRFDGSRYWPDRQWDLAIVLDNSAQRGEDHDELLERASWFYEAVSFSGGDEEPDPWRGPGIPRLLHRRRRRRGWTVAATTHLHVPADPPAKLFWSATVYDVDTRCLIDNEQQRGDRGSRDPDVVDQRRRLGRPLLRPQRAGGRRRPTGCRPSRAGTGSRTSGSTDRSSPTSTALETRGHRPELTFSLEALLRRGRRPAQSGNGLPRRRRRSLAGGAPWRCRDGSVQRAGLRRTWICAKQSSQESQGVVSRSSASTASSSRGRGTGVVLIGCLPGCWGGVVTE